MISYFKTPKGYIGVTSQSPQGMKGVVFIGRGSDNGPAGVKEQAYAKNQLAKFTPVKADEVPDEWFTAIGYEKRQPKIDYRLLREERERGQRIVIFSIILIACLLWLLIFR